MIIEPVEVYVCRMTVGPLRTSRVSEESCATRSQDLNATLSFVDGWDERILAYVRAQPEPVRIVSLASELRKSVRHRDKQHKEKLKREILIRVGALIRIGSLARVQRRYVTAEGT